MRIQRYQELSEDDSTEFEDDVDTRDSDDLCQDRAVVPLRPTSQSTVRGRVHDDTSVAQDSLQRSFEASSHHPKQRVRSKCTRDDDSDYEIAEMCDDIGGDSDDDDTDGRGRISYTQVCSDGDHRGHPFLRSMNLINHTRPVHHTIHTPATHLYPDDTGCRPSAHASRD